MTRVSKEYGIKTVQEQWLQLKIMFYRVIHWKFLFSGGNWPLAGWKSTGGSWGEILNRFLVVWRDSPNAPSRENPIMRVQHYKRNNQYQQNCFNWFWSCWSKNINFSISQGFKNQKLWAHFCASKRNMCTVMLYFRLLLYSNVFCYLLISCFELQQPHNLRSKARMRMYKQTCSKHY